MTVSCFILRSDSMKLIVRCSLAVSLSQQHVYRHLPFILVSTLEVEKNCYEQNQFSFDCFLCRLSCSHILQDRASWVHHLTFDHEWSITSIPMKVRQFWIVHFLVLLCTSVKMKKPKIMDLQDRSTWNTGKPLEESKKRKSDTLETELWIVYKFLTVIEVSGFIVTLYYWKIY